MNEIYLKKLMFEQDTTHGVGAHYKFSNSDSTQLHNVAFQNAFMGGNAVYTARILLWVEVPDVITVVQSHSPVHMKEPAKQSSYKLYPNPNSGTMTLEYKLEGSENAMFSLYSMDGRLVKQQTLTSQNKMATIDAIELNAGVYYYVIREGNKNAKAEKLIIVK